MPLVVFAMLLPFNRKLAWGALRFWVLWYFWPVFVLGGMAGMFYYVVGRAVDWPVRSLVTFNLVSGQGNALPGYEWLVRPRGRKQKKKATKTKAITLIVRKEAVWSI